MKLILIIIAMLALTCGNNSNNKIKNLNAITIEGAQTSKCIIDVKERTLVYAVFYLSRSPYKLSINLTEKDILEIVDRFYELRIDEIPSITKFDDNCLIMPKLFTIVSLKEGEKTSQLTIDENCDDFSFTQVRYAKRLKSFLKYITEWQNNRPEFKKIPQSDIIYM